MPVPNTPLYAEYEKGDFVLLSPHEAIKETRLFIENLHVNSWLLSDHISNYVNVNGKLPADQTKMLELLDYALRLDESHFSRADHRHL